MNYWEKRVQAKLELENGLRSHLISQFRDKPVSLLREQADTIRISNRVWVRKFLIGFGCEDMPAKWTVFFTYKDADGIPKVQDFDIVLDTVV